MGELIDFSAFKKQKEEKGKPKDSGDNANPFSEMLRKLDPESTLAILQIDQSRMKLIREIQDSLVGRANSESENAIQETLRGWTKDQVVEFLNESSPALLKSKPAFTVLAFKKLFDFLGE